MATLSVVPAPELKRLTLFDLEERLTALADSTELVEPEDEQEFLAEFEVALMAAKEKRDRVAQFLAYCESQAAMAKTEAARLKKRQASFEGLVERMEDYVLRVVMRQEPDAKGKYAPLEGNLSTFAAQRNPPTAIITDEAAVPAAYKTVTISMPALVWESVLDCLELEVRAQVLEAVRKPDSAVVKSQVKDAIAAAVPDWKEQLANLPTVYCDQVPGAAIAAGEYRLVRK